MLKSRRSTIYKYNKGQTLVEVLVALGVGAVLFIGAVSVIGPATRVNTQAKKVESAAALEKDLLDNASSWAEGDWTNILSVATGSANVYHLLTEAPPFEATSGPESITLGSTTYTRYFYVDDLYRDTNGNVTTTASGNSDDPSSKSITVAVGWLGGTTSTAITYVTRHDANQYSQDNWSGGGTGGTPVTVTGNNFQDESNIRYDSPGSVTLATYGQYTGVVSSTDAHWAWNDTIGWIDTYNNGSVNVSQQGLSGYAESGDGPLSFDCATSPNGNICGQSIYQVANNASGTLSGYAWNDDYGWMNFEGSGYGVTIDTQGIWHNFAWNDITGWTSFNCEDLGVCDTSDYWTQSGWTSSSTLTGYLDSTAFDTGSSDSALNSVVWQGTDPPLTTVEFQFATSSAATGPWNYSGPDGTVNTYWKPTDHDYPLSLGTNYSGFRYFKYKLILMGPNSTSTVPVVNGVSVGWSP